MVKSAIAALNFKTLFQSKAEVALLNSVAILSTGRVLLTLSWLSGVGSSPTPVRFEAGVWADEPEMSPRKRDEHAEATCMPPEALRALLARRSPAISGAIFQHR